MKVEKKLVSKRQIYCNRETSQNREKGLGKECICQCKHKAPGGKSNKTYSKNLAWQEEEFMTTYNLHSLF